MPLAGEELGWVGAAHHRNVARLFPPRAEFVKHSPTTQNSKNSPKAVLGIFIFHDLEQFPQLETTLLWIFSFLFFLAESRTSPWPEIWCKKLSVSYFGGQYRKDIKPITRAAQDKNHSPRRLCPRDFLFHRLAQAGEGWG